MPTPRPPPFAPLVCVVDFHHARGPEIEQWIGLDSSSSDPSLEQDWSLIPYMALPDGAHQSGEEFSYFSLVYRPPITPSTKPTAQNDTQKKHDNDVQNATTVFGISCCQQIAASELTYKSEDVTRSAVQKAIVVITDRPQGFSALREKLSVVTSAWFAQWDFRDGEILEVCLPIYLSQKDGVQRCARKRVAQGVERIGTRRLVQGRRSAGSGSLDDVHMEGVYW